MFTSMFSSLGVVVFMTAIIVEVLKKILPDKIPTQIVTIIVSVLCSIGVALTMPEITVALIIKAIYSGFAASFISMYGFDTFKGLYNRFTLDKEQDIGKEEDDE